jgi:hypothetical protein
VPPNPDNLPEPRDHIDHAAYGPAGTFYQWNDSQLSDSERSALERLAYWLTSKFRPYPAPEGGGAYLWSVPEGSDPPLPPDGATRMRWLHVTINGKLGATETISHTLNFRTAPAADVDQDQAAVQTFANQVRDAWAAWFTGYSGPKGGPMAALCSNQLQYVDVTAAYLEQTAPATIGTETSRKTKRPIKTFEYPRPTYLVPTQFAPFAAGVGGTDNTGALPYEVAMCVSLTTGIRGPRNRGRVYLGGLSKQNVGGDGLWAAGVPGNVGDLFAHLVHTLNTTTGARLHVVSRAYATSLGVNGVTVGAVPDSQRRRRRSLKENYAAPVAT